LNESGISNKLRDAATTRKSESLAATRGSGLPSTDPGPTLAKDERGERDRQPAGEVGEVLEREAGAGHLMPTNTGRPPLDRDRAPQTRAHGRRRLLADVLARRNWEHTRSINALRERDRHLAGETAEVQSTSPAGRTPPDRDRAPQPRTHERRRLYTDLLARRNGEYMRSFHALRERDRQLAGETVEVTVGSAGEANPQSLDVEVETRRSLVGDGRTIQDRWLELTVRLPLPLEGSANLAHKGA